MLPMMNGYEVCRAVRADLGLAGVTIVLLTAKGQDADREEGLAAGADEFRTKPFDPDEILELARSRLGVGGRVALMVKATRLRKLLRRDDVAAAVATVSRRRGLGRRRQGPAGRRAEPAPVRTPPTHRTARTARTSRSSDRTARCSAGSPAPTPPRRPRSSALSPAWTASGGSWPTRSSTCTAR